jgi:hypothetical protein
MTVTNIYIYIYSPKKEYVSLYCDMTTDKRNSEVIKDGHC